ncbi:MAG: LysM peptidoglycan-binding domain-containing protein [Limosilactobacillus sp.]|uniref:C40 family peptidase n=1 Tax=Limosilactobacillus sp. TaxID=2773925 RepID=UPI002711026B|nr:LysM peptidoglycan-binding domain-containing protein [Limosilactobacillus sp.]
MVNNKKQSHHVRHAVVGTLSALGLMALTTQAASASKVTVKSGDTVWGIAQAHGLTVKAVEDANSSIKKLDNNIDLIYAGQTLEVPDGQDSSATSSATSSAANTTAATTTATTAATTSSSASQASNSSAYTVQAGDTLSQISAKYGVTVDQLMQWNQLTGSTIYVGQQLVVNGQQTSATTAASQQATDASADNSQSTQAAAASTDDQAASAQSTDASQQAASSQQATVDTTQDSAATTANTDTQATTQAATQTQSAVQTQQQTATPTTTDNSANSQATVAQTSTASSSNSDLQSGSVVSLATKLASTNSIPYVWGGSSLSGMDCSGLVAYVYANAEGKSLPHNTVALESVVTKKSVSEAQPGDLLFWGDNGATYHVAIYIGNNQYVAAATPGTNVSVYTISPYFAPSFAGSVN